MDNVWPVLSGALAQERRMEVISNNLANVNTPGFKKEFAIFEGVSPIAAEPMGTRPVQPTPTFGVLNEVRTNFTPGEIKETGEPLDLAINGEGFFPVRTPEGIRYTRNGSFVLNDQEQIVTKSGYLLLSGTDPLVLPPGVLRIDENGKVEVLPVEASRAPNEPGSPSIARGTAVLEVGTIFLARFDDVNQLKKVGESLYEPINQVAQDILPEGLEAGEVLGQAQSALDFNGQISFSVGRIRQHALEMSNVNPVEEMVSMITVMRMYEAAQNALQTSDEVAGRAANDVGRV